jgi:two-component system cell cycle response regulator
MTARVLIVDDILANVKLLEAKLTADYFDVFTAMNGPEALDVARQVNPDIILLDVMMPGMDGFEVCRRLKSNPQMQHIPVIMVTALDQVSDRVHGLEAGADDFLTKPVNDLALFARVKSLVRLKLLTDELRSRAATGERMGLMQDDNAVVAEDNRPGRILLVNDNKSVTRSLEAALSSQHNVKVIEDPQQALLEVAESDWEVLIVGLNLKEFDGLRLCSQLRSLDRTRNLPILVLVHPDDTKRLMRGLELGVNDYLVEPVDQNEMLARVKSQLRRHRYAERLRANVDMSMELAFTDELTGLFNRRYMEGHLSTLVDQAAHRGKSISVLIFDIDHFKAVNDTHGHDTGDAVLQQFGRRLKQNIRGLDMACRHGGEEFVLVLPDTDQAIAYRVAERLRKIMASAPFDMGDKPGTLNITVSVGVASLEHHDDSPETILKRADQALYKAKQEGRNRVVSDAA